MHFATGVVERCNHAKEPYLPGREARDRTAWRVTVEAVLKHPEGRAAVAVRSAGSKETVWHDPSSLAAEVLELLYGVEEVQAIVDEPDKGGRTPLRFAAENGHAACAELLLGKGAAVDQPNEAGKTPLQLAEENGHAECAELLLPPGATTLSE